MSSNTQTEFITLQEATKLVKRHVIYSWVRRGKLSKEGRLINRSQLESLIREEYTPPGYWFSKNELDLIQLVFESCSNKWEMCDLCKKKEDCHKLYSKMVDNGYV